MYVFSRLRKVAAAEDLPIHCRHQSVWLASHPGPLASTRLSLGAPAVHAANGRLTPSSHSFIIRSLWSHSGSLVKLARTSCPSPGTRLPPKSSPLVGGSLQSNALWLRRPNVVSAMANRWSRCGRDRGVVSAIVPAGDGSSARRGTCRYGSARLCPAALLFRPAEGFAVISMRCRMTASLRARATQAFLWPLRLRMRRAQSLGGWALRTTGNRQQDY